MPNPDHVVQLKRGVASWNSWRAISRETPDLSGADLREIKLDRVGGLANTGGANLTSAVMDGADFTRASLRGADFTSASLRGTVLAGADLRETYFHVAKMMGANLRGADICGADFTKADLTNADLTHAKIQYTGFDFVSLSNVAGLETCQHLGPSDIGFRTLAQSGNLPAAFLRGCGLSDTLIDYLPALVTTPLDFYSCFISYSHCDRALADKLYDKLQSHGIRCWKDDHSIRVGENILDAVDRGIRMWDKLILICSAASLKSPWVLDEIDKALEKERRFQADTGNRVAVLIPLLLDRYMFDWVDGRATHLRTRLAGDFSNWQDVGAFAKAFDRLVTALSAVEMPHEQPPESKLKWS